ncbi:MAG: hypothetical protein IT379_29280 [Deltaproteobacteria bacterium]|nr:hypothetical protein [Deltaproteobacteria bacterium]
MLVPGLFLFSFVSGVAAAAAAQVELRLSPRSALLSRAFSAFVVFEVLLVVPVSLYFYVFHGDWTLLYVVDARHVPSALAVLLFAIEVAIGVGGFAAAAALVRGQRRTLAYVLAGAVSTVMFLGVALLSARMSVVGTYGQFRGGFGLRSWTETAVLPGVVAMLAVLLLGLAFLIVRIVASSRRTA